MTEEEARDLVRSLFPKARFLHLCLDRRAVLLTKAEAIILAVLTEGDVPSIELPAPGFKVLEYASLVRNINVKLKEAFGEDLLDFEPKTWERK